MPIRRLLKVGDVIEPGIFRNLSQEWKQELKAVINQNLTQLSEIRRALLRYLNTKS